MVIVVVKPGIIQPNCIFIPWKVLFWEGKMQKSKKIESSKIEKCSGTAFEKQKQIIILKTFSYYSFYSSIQYAHIIWIIYVMV